jgi:hypothetical protein
MNYSTILRANSRFETTSVQRRTCYMLSIKVQVITSCSSDGQVSRHVLWRDGDLLERDDSRAWRARGPDD